MSCTTSKTAIILMNYLFTNKTKLFVKYSHHQVTNEIKQSLSKDINTEFLSKRRLFTVHLRLRVYGTSFLKS